MLQITVIAGDVRENEDGDLVNVEEIEEGEDLKDSKSNALDWETARWMKPISRPHI